MTCPDCSAPRAECDAEAMRCVQHHALARVLRERDEMLALVGRLEADARTLKMEARMNQDKLKMAHRIIGDLSIALGTRP
jgi:hypothetical protein